MSADVLRSAASLMRERAEVVDTQIQNAPGWDLTWGDCIRHSLTDPDGTYLASWHPVVAIAVADWLDDLAGAWEQAAATWGPDGPLKAAGVWRAPDHHPALAVARAYLGEDA